MKIRESYFDKAKVIAKEVDAWPVWKMAGFFSIRNNDCDGAEMVLKDTPNINAAIDEISSLKEGVELLQEIYLLGGTYALRDYINRHSIDKKSAYELSNRLEKYFEFDDSE